MSNPGTYNGSGAQTINLDLTEVINSDGNNKVLTTDGDGTLSAEGKLLFDGNDLTIAGDIAGVNNITASGDISSSGDIFADDITADDLLTAGRIATTGNLTINGTISNVSTTHITASGNISASGNIITEEIEAHSNFTIDAGGDIELNADGGQIYMKDGASTRFTFNLDNTPKLDVVGAFTIDCNSDMLIDVAGGNLVLANNGTNYFDFGVDSTPEISTIGDLIIDPSGGNTFFDSHITASGNISASGDIFAHSGSFNYITASIIDVDADTIRFGGEPFTKANIQALKQGKSLKPLRAGKVNPDILAGNITASGDIRNTQTLQMTNSSSIVNTFGTGSIRSSKYVLQVTSASNYQVSEMLVLHNDGATLNTEYAQLNSGVNLVDFSTKVVNQNLQLIASSSFISCSVKFERTIIPT